MGDFAIRSKKTYKGVFESHNFPSQAEIVIEVMPLAESVIQVAVSSSDGAGATTNATYAGDGMWLIFDPVLFGTGWGSSSDPFTFLPQQRALIFSSDGEYVSYQDMGQDIASLRFQVSSEDDTGTGDSASGNNNGDDATEAGDVPVSTDPSGSRGKLASATTVRIVSTVLRMFGV
jgi:hypothetical protein